VHDSKSMTGALSGGVILRAGIGASSLGLGVK
jgi:hypothetical protein